MRPVALVDGAGFRKFIDEAVPGYKLPARKTISKTLIPEMVKEETKKLKLIINSTDYIAITSDGWTSNSATPFLDVTIHFIADKKLQAKLLDCSRDGL